MKMPRPEWLWRAGELSSRVTELERRLARMKASSAGRQETVRELRTQLAEARKASQVAVRQSRKLTRVLADAHKSLDQVRSERDTRVDERDRLAARLQQEEQKAQSRKRAVLQDRVLWDLLPSRVAAWRPDAAADARDAHLRRVSPAYGAARDAAVRDAAPRDDGDLVTIGGIRWRVPHDRRSPNRLGDRIANKGWLPLNHILQTREVTGGGTMIDIGANIGTTAIPRIYLGDAAVAYAAEAEPANYEALVFNVVTNRLAGTVLPDLIAIGAADGTAYLHRATTIGGHRVLPAEMIRTRNKAVPVRMLTWDPLESTCRHASLSIL